MSVEAMSLVLHHSRATGTAKLVLLGIANHAGDGGAWPTVATLARYANVTERAVQLSIGKLVKLGELAVDRQGGGLGYLKHYERPNRYDVLIACPSTCDRTVNHRLRPNPQGRQLELIVSDPSPSDPVNSPSPGEPPFTPPGEAAFTQTVLTQPPTDRSPRKVTTPRASRDVTRRYADQARAAIEAARS